MDEAGKNAVVSSTVSWESRADSLDSKFGEMNSDQWRLLQEHIRNNQEEISKIRKELQSLQASDEQLYFRINSKEHQLETGIAELKKVLDEERTQRCVTDTNVQRELAIYKEQTMTLEYQHQLFEQNSAKHAKESKTAGEATVARITAFEAKVEDNLRQVQATVDASQAMEESQTRDLQFQALKSMFDMHKTSVHELLQSEKTSLEEFMNECRTHVMRRVNDERQAREGREQYLQDVINTRLTEEKTQRETQHSAQQLALAKFEERIVPCEQMAVEVKQWVAEMREKRILSMPDHFEGALASLQQKLFDEMSGERCSREADVSSLYGRLELHRNGLDNQASNIGALEDRIKFLEGTMNDNADRHGSMSEDLSEQQRKHGEFFAQQKEHISALTQMHHSLANQVIPEQIAREQDTRESSLKEIRDIVGFERSAREAHENSVREVLDKHHLVRETQREETRKLMMESQQATHAHAESLADRIASLEVICSHSAEALKEQLNSHITARAQYDARMVTLAERHEELQQKFMGEVNELWRFLRSPGQSSLHEVNGSRLEIATEKTFDETQFDCKALRCDVDDNHAKPNGDEATDPQLAEAAQKLRQDAVERNESIATIFPPTPQAIDSVVNTEQQKPTTMLSRSGSVTGISGTVSAIPVMKPLTGSSVISPRPTVKHSYSSGSLSLPIAPAPVTKMWVPPFNPSLTVTQQVPSVSKGVTPLSSVSVSTATRLERPTTSSLR